MVDDFRQVAIVHCDRERYNSAAQSLKTVWVSRPGTPSWDAVDPAESAGDVSRLKDEGLAVGVWSRTGGCHSLCLKAGEEPVQLLRLQYTSAESASGVV